MSGWVCKLMHLSCIIFHTKTYMFSQNIILCYMILFVHQMISISGRLLGNSPEDRLEEGMRRDKSDMGSKACLKTLNLGRQKYFNQELSSHIVGWLLGNSQTDEGTKTCLKILDPGGQKIQPRIAWILVGKVLKPKQVNIATERICQKECKACWF